MVSNIVTGRNVVVVVVVVVVDGGVVEDVVGNVNRTNRADWYVSWFGGWYVIDVWSSVLLVVATVVPLDVFLVVVVVVVAVVGIDLEEEDDDDDDDGGNTNNA